MASKQIYLIFAIILTLAPAITLAKEFVVGDGEGWKFGFDYQKWAEGKDFVVGDTLVFKYPQGQHNVIKVDAVGFQNCTKPSDAKPLTTGNDRITLSSAGKKWYICGVGKHCLNKQKLKITVSEASEAPASPPSGAEPPSSATGMVRRGYQVIMVVIVAIAMVVMV